MSQYVAICHNVNIVLYVLLLGLGTVEGATNSSFVGPVSRTARREALDIWDADGCQAVEDLKIKILEICIFRIFPNRFIMFYPSLPCFCVLKSRVMSLPL